MTERKAEMMKEEDSLGEIVVKEMIDLVQEETDHVPETVTVNHADVGLEAVNANVAVHVHETVKQEQVTQKKVLKVRLVKVKLVRRGVGAVQDQGRGNAGLVLGTGNIVEIVIVIAKRDQQVKRENNHSKSSKNQRMITLTILVSLITTISP